MKIPFQIETEEQYHSAYQQSLHDPEQFWADIAEKFLWRQKWNKVLQWDFNTPEIKWFDNGKLNITENCLDRHLEKLGNQIALIWEPNDIDAEPRSYTYKALYDKVCEFAHVLQSNGVKKGDRVCIYMGMIPELVFCMLACARIGAIHSIIFGGFSAQSITDRVLDAHAQFVVTCDGAWRGSKEIPLKPTIDEAIKEISFIHKVFVIRHTGSEVKMQADRDVFYHEALNHLNQNEIQDFPAEIMDAEDELFILYTSGSTGKPKGIVHTSGGYMVWAAYTFANVFQYKPNQIHFCTADIGWITGHSYIVYGPLSMGATTLMFEGIPTYPDAGRFWDIIDKYDVNILYTAPTAIRSLMGFGTNLIQAHDLSSLKVLGTVGEPINNEAWHWYDEHIGKNLCPIVDTWWQTETGGIMISNLANVTPAVPTFATLPLPGIFPVLLDEHGNKITDERVTGNLCIRFPWPGMLRTTWGSHERFKQTYFSTFPGYYFTGDGAFTDHAGNIRITGRVDDVLNVSGHRLGTAEVENALNMHYGVIESAVIGYPHDIKGQGIYAFVNYSLPLDKSDHVRQSIIDTVTKVIGPIAKPDKIQFVSNLPKTRSGKIMRRILRKIAEGEAENLGDTSTLLDPSIIDELIKFRQ